MDNNLLSNADENKTPYLFKLYSGTMLFLSLIPQSILLYYFYITEKKIEKSLNVTEISEYVDKIKHLVDVVCDSQNICDYS